MRIQMQGFKKTTVKWILNDVCELLESDPDEKIGAVVAEKHEFGYLYKSTVSALIGAMG